MADYLKTARKLLAAEAQEPYASLIAAGRSIAPAQISDVRAIRAIVRALSRASTLDQALRAADEWFTSAMEADDKHDPGADWLNEGGG